MRIGTFLLGGLVGAAAVVYFTDKKNRSMMFSAISSPTDSLNKLFGKSKEKAFESMMGGSMGQTATAATGSTKSGTTVGTSASSATASGKDGLAQVEKIVNEDPQLKRTVNEILSDNNKAAATLQ
jgi:hypothetical protein